MAENKEKLFSDFPSVSTDAWMEKVTADLKGADFEKKLVWRTNEGFNVRPFYRREDLEGLRQMDALPGEFPYLRGNRKNDNSWLIRQDIRVEEPAEANAKALDILNRGVDALGFSIKAKQLDEAYLETLLKDIKADCVELNFSTCQGHVVELVQLLVACFKKHGYDLSKLRGSIAYDPLGKMLSKGKERTVIAETGKKLIEVSAELCGYQVLGVDASILCDAGAYIYQELGYALAWGNEYMQVLTEAGVPAKVVAKNIKFNFGVSSNYFMEIAKFRAARMLWADIVEQYLGPDDCKCAARMHIHAITSRFNLTLFDSYVNLLRTQTEAMSAALAGVESMTVLPFDAVYAEPNEFSERLARNQQLLLREESHFDKVVDPAGGSQPSRPARCRRQSMPATGPATRPWPVVRKSCWAPTNIPTSLSVPRASNPCPDIAVAEVAMNIPARRIVRRSTPPVPPASSRRSVWRPRPAASVRKPSC